MNNGNNGNKNQLFSWAKIILVKFIEPLHNTTVIIIKPIDTSYEII